MLWCLMLFISNVAATIVVPDEVPSILSIVYSNIPPIKKGTDSRVGFGFAVGPFADFQVLFELGPQQETQQSPMPFPHKRKVAGKQTQKSQTKRKVESSNSNGTEFLDSWSQQFKQKKTSKPFQPLPIPDDDKNAVPTGIVDLKKIVQAMGMSEDGQIKQPKPSISFNALNKLKELYGQKVNDEEKIETTTNNKPRFVLKKNTSKPSTPTKLPSSFERLTQFTFEGQKADVVKKRKITEDLSDVSLDDE